jgi:predicted amidophosphoribosyltransferase
VRLAERGYNQAGLLARSFVSHTRAETPRFAPRLLERGILTAAQARLAPRERVRNVVGAFRVRQAKLVAGQRVLLVDDVVTTGETARACVGELVAAGAAEVSVLAVALGGRGRGRPPA